MATRKHDDLSIRKQLIIRATNRTRLFFPRYIPTAFRVASIRLYSISFNVTSRGLGHRGIGYPKIIIVSRRNTNVYIYIYRFLVKTIWRKPNGFDCLWSYFWWHKYINTVEILETISTETIHNAVHEGHVHGSLVVCTKNSQNKIWHNIPSSFLKTYTLTIHVLAMCVCVSYRYNDTYNNK